MVKRRTKKSKRKTREYLFEGRPMKIKSIRKRGNHEIVILRKGNFIETP